MDNVKKSDAINTYDEEKKDGYKKIPSGMLSSPHIKYCILQYKIITCEDETKDALLKQVNSAVYKMRLGNDVWGHTKNGDLLEEIFPDCKSIILEPNSLTYLTTKEAFNLPKDIIVRFNLKSGLVHKGLLLGTGPIVDPEFQGRLLIPVHNFSNSPVRLSPGDSFINVEFTKTLNPEEDSLKTLYPYEKNKNNKFEPSDYVKKMDNIPSSSVFEQYAKFNKYINTLKYSAIFTGLSLLVAIAALIYTAFSMYSSFSGIVAQAQKDISNFNALLRIEEKSAKSINTKQFVLRHEYDELKENYEKLQKELNFYTNTINCIKQTNTYD